VVLNVLKQGKRVLESFPAGLGAAFVLLERHLVDDQIVNLLLGLLVRVLHVKVQVQIKPLLQLLHGGALFLGGYVTVFVGGDSHVELTYGVVSLLLQVLVVRVDQGQLQVDGPLGLLDLLLASEELLEIIGEHVKRLRLIKLHQLAHLKKPKKVKHL
jgi:hypothetical protein